MLVRRRHGLGLAVATLALSSLSIGTAAGATPSGPTTATGVTASAAPAGSGAAAGPSGVVATPDSRVKKCGTRFGVPFDNGIVSNKSEAIRSSGAADFTCTDDRRTDRQFSTVKVQGYSGDAGSTTFAVEVLTDCGGEPCDHAKPVCSTTGVGAPTGAEFPDADTIKIALAERCRANPGTNWLQVQAVTATDWYWRGQASVGATYPADWKEGGAFRTGCEKYENGMTMQECIFGGESGMPDFMFKLKK